MQTDSYLSPCTKPKFKWIKDFNINPATVNLREEKVGNSLECIGTGGNFLNKTPVAKTLQSTICKWDLKLKTSITQSSLSVGKNSSLKNGKRSSPIPHLTEGLSPKYMKNSKN